MVASAPAVPFQRATGRASRSVLREGSPTGVAVMDPSRSTLSVQVVLFGFLARLLRPAAVVLPGPPVLGPVLAGIEDRRRSGRDVTSSDEATGASES